MRSLAIASLVAAVTIGGLWGIWAFESGSAGAGGGPEDGSEFSYQLPDKDGSVPDLILYCPEDVMTEPADAFAKWLKMEDGSALTVPGGAMLLARLNDVTLDESLKPLQRSTVEVLKRYSPKRVALVSHTYCVYYDTIAAWNDDLAGVKNRQMDDMRIAMSAVASWFPRAQISGYLAEEDAGRKLVFHAVTPDGTPAAKGK